MLTEDPVDSLQEDLLGLVPVASLEGPIQPPVVATVEVGEDTVLILQRAKLGLSENITH